MDEYHKVMTENFTKRFVDHRGIGLTPERVTKLPLEHGNRTLDIRAFVIVLQKLIALEHKEVIHVFPQNRAGAIAGCALFERNEGCAVESSNRINVLCAAVSLVSRYFGDRECFGRFLNQRNKEGAVIGVLVANLNRRYDIGFDAAHDMRFDPIYFFSHSAVLVIVPTGEPRSAEARRVHGEIDFHSGERQTALPNQVAQYGSESVIFKVIEDRIVMREPGDQAAIVRLAEIAHESAARETGVDLERCGEYSVREWQVRSTTALNYRLLDASAQIAQQLLKSILLGRLSFCCSFSSPADKSSALLRSVSR
jgi:hypothetical protein